MKKILNLIFSRAVIIGLLILLQLFFVFYGVIRFSEYVGVFYGIFTVLNFAVVCKIVSSRENPSYKIAWIILILAMPPLGLAMYILFRGNSISRKLKRILANIYGLMSFEPSDHCKAARKTITDEIAARQSDYMTRGANCPPYADTEVSYFPCGEELLPVLLDKLEQAEKYIFLEYFIIEEGTMWNSILEVLKRKAQKGVDVRVVYDDMGCIALLSAHYKKKLAQCGIKCRVFGRCVPILSATLNNRDHRKICVIDGKWGFTGGINIADEYINEKTKYGYWKDNAVMLYGKAVWSLTVMFLSMWDSLDIKNQMKYPDYDVYLPENFDRSGKGEGIVQPYTDNPFDDSPVSETVYLNMIYSAKEYIWITTPYLIIDHSMERALCTAAESGIDVRIITPGIPDKKVVYEVTRSNYKTLIALGVKIYEYTPGFIHAKTFVCDGKYATVGTVNLDFRSLYLHFECGVWIYDAPVIEDIRADLEKTIAESRRVTADSCKVNVFRRALRALLELFSPLF